MKRFLASLTLLFALGGFRLMAVEITFSSPAFEIGETSMGDPLTSGFTFALGSFGDFTPTAANVSDWAANFTALGTTTWEETFSQFIDITTLASNTAPFEAASPAYVWGYDTTSGASEWVLFANAAWTLPNSADLLPVEWTTADDGTYVIVGSLGAAQVGAMPYIRTAAVDISAVPEPSSYAFIFGLVALAGVAVRRSRRWGIGLVPAHLRIRTGPRPGKACSGEDDDFVKAG